MEWHTALALVLSGTIGVSLGLLGGGGSILAVPVLVYVAGIEATLLLDSRVVECEDGVH
jgi:uncharacterized membrane protein YfcA